MSYTSEQIVHYTNILEEYKNTKENIDKVTCCNCGEDNFSIYLGQNICDSCGVFNGYILGVYDIKDQDRLYYKKKSIYNRKYHYEKKVDIISKRINLTDEEKYELYNKLMKIDNSVMEILNKQFCRKRMINIFYLIKKILEEMKCKKYKLVYLKISPQTLENYEKWWENYLSIR